MIVETCISFEVLKFSASLSFPISQYIFHVPAISKSKVNVFPTYSLLSSGRIELSLFFISLGKRT